MEKEWRTLFGPTVLPAALVGFSSNVFQQWLPQLSTWIGWVSLVLLLIVTAVAIVLLATQRVVPRRFANLLYVFDEQMSIAMIEHPHHKRLLPPGSRLGYHEAPDEAIPRVLRSELGLEPTSVHLFSTYRSKRYGDVELRPAPVQVQSERHSQRLGVREHYDYVYAGRVAGVRPPLKSALNPKWMSIGELRQLAEQDITRAPFSDVIPTFERIVAAMTASEQA